MTTFQIIERRVRKTGDGVGERTPQCAHPGCLRAGRFIARFLDSAMYDVRLCSQHRVEYAQAWNDALSDWQEAA